MRTVRLAAVHNLRHQGLCAPKETQLGLEPTVRILARQRLEHWHAGLLVTGEAAAHVWTGVANERQKMLLPNKYFFAKEYNCKRTYFKAARTLCHFLSRKCCTHSTCYHFQLEFTTNAVLVAIFKRFFGVWFFCFANACLVLSVFRLVLHSKTISFRSNYFCRKFRLQATLLMKR